MKKFLAILMTLALVLSLAVPAMAADITINGGAEGSEYAAYKLLNATHNPGGEGEGDDLFAYTLNSKYTEILQAVTDKTTQADIIDYISELNAAGIRDFADDVYVAIKTAGLTADYTTSTDSFADVAQGYYLIAETKVGDNADTFSLVMLDTAGDENITVYTKESAPTVEKKVEEKNDTTNSSSWGDSADYDLNDTINFKITGTVSNKYADYESYYYSFGDTMDTGLTLNTDSIMIMIGEENVTSQFKIETTEHSFTATANLKELSGVTITADTKIIVTYTATLNESAIAGTAGNTNKVVLEYENNPYQKGDGNPETPDKPDEPGTTPEDTNVVFTYDVIVNKTDKAGNALEGAGFTLYKEVNGVWAAVCEEIKGATTFEFKKLDEGKYKLVETTVPDGYNKADDIEFEVKSTLTDGDTPKLSDLEVTSSADEKADGEVTKFAFTVTKDTGRIETAVVNLSGTELPETGGMGTTIFYIVGGLLVVGAAVLLITKKRMSAEG